MHPVLSPGSAPALLGRLTDVSMGSRRQMPHRAGSLSREGWYILGGVEGETRAGKLLVQQWKGWSCLVPSKLSWPQPWGISLQL